MRKGLRTTMRAADTAEKAYNGLAIAVLCVLIVLAAIYGLVLLVVHAVT